MTIHKELETLKLTELDAGEVFSGKKSNTKIKGYEQVNSFTPGVDGNYVFHELSRDVIVWFMHNLSPLYLFGPSGSGKTSVIKQLAAKLNYPVFEINGHSRLEYLDMVGHLSLQNGSMQFEYGPLALAMKYGGLFLLNEIDLIDPATAAGLNSVLDGAPLCIPENGGELIKPHENFRFAATANTNGGSDETSSYNGTLKQNLAFMDRFYLCEAPYPTVDTELKLLAKVQPNLPEMVRSKMVEFANEVRNLFVGNIKDEFDCTQKIDITFSTRTLLRWAELIMLFQPLVKQKINVVNYALDRALSYRASSESRILLTELSQRIFADGE